STRSAIPGCRYNAVAMRWEVAGANQSFAGRAHHRKRMPNAMNIFTWTVDKRVIWSRIGAVTSLLIVAIAAVTLFRLLRGIDFGKVITALQTTSIRTVLIAAIVVAGYATLTLYDLFSLRAIGRFEVPYRIAALASFTSYSIGHTLGATVFTGGAGRFRIYSAWGLSLLEVAKI